MRKYKCLRTLRMIDPPKEICFIKDKIYKRIDGFAGIGWGFVDEENEQHEITGSWEKYFKEVKDV
jgi:hypothetical protein